MLTLNNYISIDLVLKLLAFKSQLILANKIYTFDYIIKLYISLGDDGYLVTRDVDPGGYYQGDYKSSNIKPICTQDLLCWAYQLANGMDYLASRKVTVYIF